MRTEEEHRLYMERGKRELRDAAIRRFEFEVGDILVQTGGTEYHPRWYALNPRRYLGTYPFPRINNLLYLGVSWQLLDNNSMTWGWAYEFYSIGSQRKYFFWEYPSYLHGCTFKKITGVD